MEDKNQTIEIQFHSHPFSPILETQIFIFVAFLLMYIGSLIGNTMVVLTVWTECSFHTPAYLFLDNPAVLEIFYSSTAAPPTLANPLTMGKRAISFTGCGTQVLSSWVVLFPLGDHGLWSVCSYLGFLALHPQHEIPAGYGSSGPWLHSSLTT